MMNTFYHFVRENHILAIIDVARINESIALNLTDNDIKTIPDAIGNCTCLMKLYLHKNSISKVISA